MYGILMFAAFGICDKCIIEVHTLKLDFLLKHNFVFSISLTCFHMCSEPEQKFGSQLRERFALLVAAKLICQHIIAVNYQKYLTEIQIL